MKPIENTESAGAFAAKVSLPASVSVATVFGIELSDFVLILTAIYTFLLIVHKAYVMIQDFKHRENPCLPIENYKEHANTKFNHRSGPPP